MKTENEAIKTYAKFWDFYVAEHAQPLTRYLHFIGTTLSLVLLVWIIRSGSWLYFPLCLIVGYAFAWFAHFLSNTINQPRLSIRSGHLFPITKWFFI